jgi:hypothetical protein
MSPEPRLGKNQNPSAASNPRTVRTPGTSRSGGSPTRPEIREVLDEAVRCLAVSSGSLSERVSSAALVLGKIGSREFSNHEDRGLIDSVRLGLMRLDLADRARRANDIAPLEPWDDELEAVAERILQLRDLATDRMIREANLRAT